MKRYKMRAECVSDVGGFLKVVPTGRVTITPCSIDGAWIPDVDVTFTSPWSLERLRAEVTEHVQDGHVMAETVALAKDYTGERISLCYLCGAPSMSADEARCGPCRDAARETIKARIFAERSEA